MIHILGPQRIQLLIPTAKVTAHFVISSNENSLSLALKHIVLSESPCPSNEPAIIFLASEPLLA